MQLPPQRRRLIWMVILAVAFGTLAVLSYAYRARLKLGFSALVEETGSRSVAALCLGLSLLALASLALWMVFPLLVYFGLRDLRHRTSALDETVRRCAEHLSRLSDAGPQLRSRATADPTELTAYPDSSRPSDPESRRA